MADDGGAREPGVWFDLRVVGGGQGLLLCKRCGKSVGICESLRMVLYMSDSILDQVIQQPEVIYTLAQELVAEREQLEGIRKQLDRVFCV